MENSRFTPESVAQALCFQGPAVLAEYCRQVMEPGAQYFLELKKWLLITAYRKEFCLPELPACGTFDFMWEKFREQDALYKEFCSTYLGRHILYRWPGGFGSYWSEFEDTARVLGFTLDYELWHGYPKE